MAWMQERVHLLETPSEVAVFQFLCWRANPDADHSVWVSKATIAGHACVSARTVATVIKKLEARGLLIRGEQAYASAIPANRRPVVWRIPVDSPESEAVDNSAQGCNEATSSKSQGCNDCMPRGATISTLGCNGCTQKEKIKNKPKKKSMQRAREESSTTLATVATRLAAEGFTESQIQRAAAQWHHRSDIRHPNALRFLAEDERERDRVYEEAWGDAPQDITDSHGEYDPWGANTPVRHAHTTEELPIVIYSHEPPQADSVAERGEKPCLT